MHRTYSFCALLELLGEVPERIEARGRDMVIKFTDLVVKCLIKITKTLSLTIQACANLAPCVFSRPFA